MRWLDVLLYASLIFFVLYVTRINNMWGMSKGTRKARNDVRLEKNREKSRERLQSFLYLLARIDKKFGLPLSEYKRKDLEYKISRLRIYFKSLNRELKPNELSGLFKLIKIVSVFLGVVGVVLTGNTLVLLLGLFYFTPAIFHVVATSIIEDEDDNIEKAFPNLYLILYNRLLQGSKARISQPLTDYLITLNTQEETRQTKAIRNFVMDLRNNIEIYGDDSIAIQRIRDKYTSVMIINFCNLAVQAFNGVNNADKLLAFKIELAEKDKEQITKIADNRIKRGNIAAYSIFLILFEIILISWLAKFSQTDGVGGIFGL